jgi:hypothetical protein
LEAEDAREEEEEEEEDSNDDIVDADLGDEGADMEWMLPP